ncbi:NaeI family type II restriction endonuclease [Streptomyces litchfieldiae]|uniref:NaeI family type II restriction endonuclease n=1 Tax=Streptomyces litchfieldiae TaxID=3075543 RepID=A0ABU2N3L5_9ACTN|nr:NaeI family type II restriction endonuclease [Streptomyces sp. DSM 44938]MDT0347648.1 NaeI family type II restriction endonuclease [Streptomyces sp. DSM 44938]
MLPLDFSAARNAAVSSPSPEPDAQVLEVATWFRSFPTMDQLFATSLRQAIDEVLDGQRTGRYDITADTVERTEKTYLGTKVEIIIRAAFNIPRGTKMDYLVAGHEVDAKFTLGDNWTIPSEAQGHICLLMMAADSRSSFRVGLLRITDSVLNPGENRDKKRSLSRHGRAAVYWLSLNGVLPENTLLHLPTTDRKAIFSCPDGQARTDEFFRRVQRKIVNRSTVLTVAMQNDSLKRVRDARDHLRPEGIIILGGTRKEHQRIAAELHLPVPTGAEWVAARVTPAHHGASQPVATIGGAVFTLAGPGTEPTEAPRVAG